MKIGASLLNIYYEKNYLSRTYRIDFTEYELDNEQPEIITVDRFYLRLTPNALIPFQFT